MDFILSLHIRHAALQHEMGAT